MKRAITIFSVICIILSIFSGCSSSPDDIRINYPIDSDPNYLDPQIVNNPSAQIVVSNCFEGLLRYDKDGNLKPAAAESYTVSDDNTVYTFNLRKNAKWHMIDDFADILGEDYEKTFDNSVTAHDFVFAMQRAVSPEIDSPSVASLYSIKNAQEIFIGKKSVETLGVTAVDDYTLQITLNYPNPDFLPSLTSAVFMPCNQKFYEATNGRYGTDVEFLMCNAPMYLSEWDVGSYVLLQKNPDYNGTAKIVAGVLGLYVNSDKDSRLTKLNEETYCASPIDEKLFDGIDSDCSVKQFESSNLSLVFNCDDPVFSNMNLRLAFCHGINIEAEKRPSGIIPNTCTLGEKSYRELSGTADMLLYNEEAAKEYFAKGFEQLENPPANITLLCTSDTEELAKSLLPNWQILFGYKLIVKIEVTDSIDSELVDGNYTFAIATISSDNETAVNFISHFGSESKKNFANYNSQNLNTVLSQLQKSTSQADMVAGCKQAEEHLMQNGVICPLKSKNNYFAVHKDFEDIIVSPSGENIWFVK